MHPNQTYIISKAFIPTRTNLLEDTKRQGPKGLWEVPKVLGTKMVLVDLHGAEESHPNPDRGIFFASKRES